MCGRYTIFTKIEALEERFHAKMMIGKYVPNYNATPSQKLPVILNTDRSAIIRAQWGFIPHWMKDAAHARAQINARVETAAEKPYFRDVFSKRRCLVLVDGFYEWDKKGNKKIPYRIAFRSGEPFAFAGIWDELKQASDEHAPVFAILTMDADPLIAHIHSRMPIILKKENEDRWLEGEPFDEDTQSIIEPVPVKNLRCIRKEKKEKEDSHDLFLKSVF